MDRRYVHLADPGPDRLARRFFQAAIALFAVAAVLAWLLIRAFPPPPLREGVGFPAAFWISTLLLGFGSVMLHRATWQVRHEKQGPFRRSLLAALAGGILFIGVQSLGLWSLLQQQQIREVATGAGAFVFVFAFLHCMHFVVAMLCLLLVTVRALVDRYDHEYYWGVVMCGYFWHALGLVWLAILGVLAIVA